MDTTLASEHAERSTESNLSVQTFVVQNVESSLQFVGSKETKLGHSLTDAGTATTVIFVSILGSAESSEREVSFMECVLGNSRVFSGGTTRKSSPSRSLDWSEALAELERKERVTFEYV